MLKQLNIQNYKCLETEELSLEKLTILTGVNSSGKSSVIQCILLLAHYFGETAFLEERFRDFSVIKNRYLNAKELKISLDTISVTLAQNKDDNSLEGNESELKPTIDKNIFRLSENRSGPEELPKYDSDSTIGKEGEFIFSLYEKHKSSLINEKLTKDDRLTLYANVDYWLSYILDAKVELNTQKVTADTIKVSYNFGELDNVSPYDLGAGVSYLAKILTICLYAQPGNIILIENPEIHLYPKAQSRLGEFFAFVSTDGPQLILETHCEHLINRLRYEVYSGTIDHEDVSIYYKNSSRSCFKSIRINQRGHFIDKDDHVIQFPTGFFDSTLAELLEIG